MRILIVEDEPVSLKLARLVLAAEGHEVIGAEAVGKAVAEILRSEPDVILLDLELPGIDGLTLASNLKRNQQTQHIVIIAITVSPERYPRELPIAAGCDGLHRQANRCAPKSRSRSPKRSRTRVRGDTPMKILIVDDIETNRKLLRVNLEGEGIETLEATDGINALAVLQTEKADAIISDILMPLMDGYPALSGSAQKQSFRGHPIHLLHEYLHLAERRKARDELRS